MSDKKETLYQKLDGSRQSLLALVDGIEAEQWQTAVYGDGATWSIADMLRHLNDAERGMTRLMGNIRDGGEGASADFDLARWNASRVEKAKDKSVTELLASMAQNRDSLKAFIASLNEEDWGKEGRHGSGRIMTVEAICNLIAEHEVSHVNDIQAALG